MVTDIAFKELKKEVTQNRLGNGVGYRLKRTASGTIIDIKGGKGGGASQPFQMMVAMSDDETPVPMIRVLPSTLAGGSSLDLGFAEGDSPIYLLTPSVGLLVGGITIDDTTGEITSRWLEIVTTIPEPSTTEGVGTYYVEIGTVGQDESFNWIVSNSRYGPIDANICRNWFAADAPFYGVTFLPAY